jgi:hypothetical protein
LGHETGALGLATEHSRGCQGPVARKNAICDRHFRKARNGRIAPTYLPMPMHTLIRLQHRKRSRAEVSTD